MPVVILAGGYGTRLSEVTHTIPKPMVEIGGKPIIWHIMKQYRHYGFKEFYIALGYKGDVIKTYFANYHTTNSNMTVNLATGSIDIYDRNEEDWIVHLIDTGKDTMTGGRVRRLQSFMKAKQFMLTYGDGVSNIDISDLLHFHQSHGKIGTVTAVRPPARFGGLVFDGNRVTEFTEKPQTGEGWINGGFMVFESTIFDYFASDEDSLERTVLERLAWEGELMAYKHNDFWQSMDTLRDVGLLESLWEANAPWKMW
ncbi:MAG: glucose-1-phosphate cytidylyltransferase [Anaerolineae bacterium]|nr:glucose-1-phosphate cytidylyltransferase [Anaerolineae bacterium]